ncbi:MAG: homogentisate 1,2-dioxygenase [Candidatus Berkiella sp.]
MSEEFQYQNGFGGYLQTEALPNALPHGQNSPQKPAYSLYAEQLSGSAFTRPRSHNLRTWLYRILPSVSHLSFQPLKNMALNQNSSQLYAIPNQLRWDPLADPTQKQSFIAGCQTLIQNGNPLLQEGAAVHLYTANENMDDDFFYSADGEWLIVPYLGRLILKTEFGVIALAPSEIAVIPRGIKFQVTLIDPIIKGYICENFGAPFGLPDLGPIGSNGLASPRDFLYPTAHFEDKTGTFNIICKYANQLWQAQTTHSPLDVVAWHGNYAPYKYDLRLFNTINTVSFDHCDPSIFTVLTSATSTPGLANLDFVIFPERWMVAEHTFRPPYYHRNIMSEYMGLIHGHYDAKNEGFLPGGGSLHNCMSSHGPDGDTAEKGMHETLLPIKQENTLAFMFESRLPWQITEFGMQTSALQKSYQDCWQNIPKLFNQKS